MRVVFMGTPEFAGDILKELAARFEVVGVYTRPDAVRGRGKKAVASPVKEVASALGIPVYTPRTLRDEAQADTLRSLRPDAICVAAYGAILPKEVLEIPPLGCLNVHASLLPRWRGAAPVERAILAGDETAGVCIMAMEEGLDTGDYCLCEEVPVGDRTASELTSELGRLGASLLCEALEGAAEGRLVWNRQNEADATYADKVGKGELDLSPALSVSDNVRRVRASSAAHPARAQVAGRAGTVMAARRAEGIESAAEPGACLWQAKRLYLGCSDGWFELTSFKPDGKAAMDAAAFAAGNPAIRAGEAVWGPVDGAH